MDPLPCRVQILPPVLCDILAGLASNPVAAMAVPEVHSFALRWLPCLRPEVAAQLEAAAELQCLKLSFLGVVQRLASAPTSALAAAWCYEVHQQVASLALLSAQERRHVVATSMAAAGRHAGAPAAGDVAAALLLAGDLTVRQAALEALVAEPASPALLHHDAVAGSLVVALGEPTLQRLAAELLQAAAVGAPALCGAAMLPWEMWLLCHTGSPAAGPAVSCVLEVLGAQKRSGWQHMAPIVLALFHRSPAVAAEAAAQLHTALVQRPSAAMLFNPLPFDGLLAPAGSTAQAHQNCTGASKAAAAIAARLFTAADVQSLLAVIGNPSLPRGLAAAALTQLSQVAGDERFAAILATETGVW